MNPKLLPFPWYYSMYTRKGNQLLLCFPLFCCKVAHPLSLIVLPILSVFLRHSPLMSRPSQIAGKGEELRIKKTQTLSTVAQANSSEDHHSATRPDNDLDYSRNTVTKILNVDWTSLVLKFSLIKLAFMFVLNYRGVWQTTTTTL